VKCALGVKASPESIFLLVWLLPPGRNFKNTTEIGKPASSKAALANSFLVCVSYLELEKVTAVSKGIVFSLHGELG
jgi:hypothetical protein